MTALSLLQQKADGRKYRPKSELYIALESMDFSWYQHEVATVKRLWITGKSIGAIAEAFDRDPDEVAVLIMSLAKERKIRPRPGGAYGEEC